MTKRMLIDATHAEETRVVVLDGNRLEDFDVETSTKKQLKGNIYLAKVVRVEPSLQAAFVEYGGGRHGFLAFGEIHPDYYQIPVADRQRLLEMQAEEARAEEEEDDEPLPQPSAVPEQVNATDVGNTGSGDIGAADTASEPAQAQLIAQEVKFGETSYGEVTHGALDLGPAAQDAPIAEPPQDHQPVAEQAVAGEAQAEPVETTPPQVEAVASADEGNGETVDFGSEMDIPPNDLPPPEVLGGQSDVFEGNGAEEARARRSSRMLRNYRIQEVIKRRQILLVQVVKEERGTKGAALTTYISLAGRFCVLMPNSPRGGGISRKITSAADRRRLKEITAELEIPQGMGLIVRTAGAARPKPEIRRDCEYLMRLWDDIREHTMRSVAPALIYEEASLIKRTIRDVYSRDVDEVLVDGEEGWRAAHDFMRMLMPSHAKKVQLWRPTAQGGQPLFSANGVEAQLDSMLTPNVQLKSGGYLVINQTEALVAIDVNSGRSTRERGIEETALRTNLEAADEVARQLRLRDLAGLIVIDFIDMEAKKHNGMVERRLKEALKNDRARIQVGHISHFGLMEMSRQRLRSSLAETSFVTCPHCAGLGLVRSVESAAIHVLRAIEEEGGKGRASLIMVHVANSIVMYILNNKRDRLAEIEARTAMRVQFAADETLLPPEIRIDRLRPQVPEAERQIAAPVAPAAPMLAAPDYDEDDHVSAEIVAEEAAPAVAAPSEAASESEEETEQRRRRRRRRRGGRRDGAGEGRASTDATGSDAAQDETVPLPAESAEVAASVEVAESGEIAQSAEAAEPVQPAEPVVSADPVPMEAAGEEAQPVTDPAASDQPSTDPADLDEDGQPKARRRGRRGGRRRRRDSPEDQATADGDALPEAPQPAPAPAYTYTGPTPANPFGGHNYDIFDIMDQVVEEPRAAPPPPPPAPEVTQAPAKLADAAAAETAVEPPVEAAPVETPVQTPVEAPVQAEPATQAAEVMPAEPEAAPAEQPAAIAEAAPEVTPAPESAITPATPPKRGWWRR